MAYRVEFSRRFQAELAEIHAYYMSVDGKKHSQKISDQMRKLIERLGSLPRSGVAGGQFLKAVITKRYIVFYKVSGKRVRLIRIFDGRTNYKVKEGK